jgi:hypothetical protein
MRSAEPGPELVSGRRHEEGVEDRDRLDFVAQADALPSSVAVLQSSVTWKSF